MKKTNLSTAEQTKHLGYVVLVAIKVKLDLTYPTLLFSA